ncbi:major capsid protein [Metabacillus fastidiosus]|uniref:Major capsid protein n=1 Tax=Metabacillus fastidiosus TaxID=1458 RepID=A0ABU6NRS2_9BACI|nr:major capsid protein [Metabacillus fastidiosus]
MAGITHLKQFQKDYLRGLVDESVSVREEAPTFGQQYLPNLTVYSNTFTYDIIKQAKHLAAFIGYGAEPPVMDRDAVAQKFGSLAAFGLQYIATVEELMALNQARNDGERNAIIERLEKKTIDIVNGIQDFSDVLRAKALTTGKLQYTKEDVQINFDYQIPANHKIALTGTNKWSDPTADILGNLIEWNETYSTSNNGKVADEILMPLDVFALMTKNASIIAEARPGITGVKRISQDEVNSVLEQYGLPVVRIIRSRVTTVRNVASGQDEAVEFYPAGRVVFIGKGLGNFYYGPNPEAEDFTPGIVVRAEDEKRPKRSIIDGYAAGFPIIEVPSLLLHAEVL